MTFKTFDLAVHAAIFVSLPKVYSCWQRLSFHVVIACRLTKNVPMQRVLNLPDLLPHLERLAKKGMALGPLLAWMLPHLGAGILDKKSWMDCAVQMVNRLPLGIAQWCSTDELWHTHCHTHHASPGVAGHGCNMSITALPSKFAHSFSSVSADSKGVIEHCFVLLQSLEGTTLHAISVVVV